MKMQYRKREDYVRESQSMKLHAQDRLHLDPGRDCNPRREALDRSPRLRRSLSPHGIDGSRHEVGLGQRIDTMGRRDDDWYVKSGRNNNVWSRSPSYGQVRKRAHFDEESSHKNHRQLSELQQIRGLPEHRNFPVGDGILDYKHALRYNHNDLRIGKEKQIIEDRWSDGSQQRMMDQKPFASEDRTALGAYSSPLDMGSMSIYGDTGVLLPSSRSLDVRCLDNERLKFQSPVVSDKLQIPDSHKFEHHKVKSRNVAYPVSSGFYSREYASSSSVPLTSKCLESYQDGQYFQTSDEFSRSHGDLMDPIGFTSYGKRTLVDSDIDHEVGKRNFTPHQRGANSPRRKHGDYFYSKSEGIVNDSRGYPSGEIQIITQTHDCIDYDGAIASDHGNFLRPKVAATGLLKLQNAENLCANHRTGIAYTKKRTVLDYPDMGRTTKVIKHDSENAGTGSIHIEVGRRVSQVYETSHVDPSQYCQILHARSDYGSEREVIPQFLKERLHGAPISKYNKETYRNTERVQRVTEGVDTFKLREHVHKRKYCEENMNLSNHRMSMPCEYTPSEVVELYDSDEERIDDDFSGRYTSRKAGLLHNKYKESNKKYDQNDFYVANDLFSSESYLDGAQKYKNGPRYMKGNRRHGPPSWIKSQNFGHRNSLHRQHKVWKKTEEDNDYVNVNDDDPSDDLVFPIESEPSEDSEEFKQMVHEAFLKYSKKLNMKPGVRKRYKEQGNAGSLYCIVCGISCSKEFMDTQRLVKHAYMSRKVGLRAQHLGLVQAICVLMGWNSVIPQDSSTWVPEVLPESEALVQKEDLIIWPPLIVIRNITLAHSNPNKWMVVTIEALESFLRSKGLLKGRVKMYLGRPADQSVIVLKFLATFSGLTDAERLHKFFFGKKHGRVDFELAKCRDGGGGGIEGDRIEEKILYGYMGIAEDLDEVEFNIKKLSLIKSKKEILEL